MVENSTEQDTTVQSLVKAFFKCCLPEIKGVCIKSFTWGAQEEFLSQTIYSSLFKQYPGSSKFYRLFFKNLIQSLEQDQEVHDGFYEFLCSIMDNVEDKFSYRHYLIDNSLNYIVTLKETKSMVLNGTTGLRTWEAAFMLSDWAICHKEMFLNKSVLELGSGVGFTGITIAKHCNVKSIVMSDFHDEVLQTINDNVLINFSNSKLEHYKELTVYKNNNKDIGVLKLDWNDTEGLPQDVRPDIIIGADIVYDPSILKSLVSVLEFFHKRNKDVEIYITSVIRNADTFNGFLNILESSNFNYETFNLSTSVHIEWDENLVRSFLKINK